MQDCVFSGMSKIKDLPNIFRKKSESNGLKKKKFNLQSSVTSIHLPEDMKYKNTKSVVP